MYPNILQEVDLSIVSGEDCTREYEGILNIDAEKNLCAGYQTGGKDTCLGLLKLRYYRTKLRMLRYKTKQILILTFNNGRLENNTTHFKTSSFYFCLDIYL